MDNRAEALRALARADLLLLAARLLRSPAASRDQDLLIAERDLDELMDGLGSPRGGALREALKCTIALANETDPAAWAAEHTRLFEGPVVCPINETAYIRRDKGLILADICGFFTAFGFEHDGTSGEKPDQLVSALEFAAMLLVMTGRARERGDRVAAEVSRDGLRAFLADHLADWITLFVARLAGTTTLPLYVGIAGLLRGAWDVTADALDLPSAAELEAAPIPTAPEAWDEPDPADDETPYECGLAEAGQSDFVPLTGPAGP